MPPGLPRALPLFFFHSTAPSAIYPLSLHDALPIFSRLLDAVGTPSVVSRNGKATGVVLRSIDGDSRPSLRRPDRKSTRLNSSHQISSYAVFCLKKKTR